jgi:hypothetical protein
LFFPKLKKGNFIIFRLQEMTTLIDKRSSKTVSVTDLKNSTLQRPNLICTFIYILHKNIWYMYIGMKTNKQNKESVFVLTAIWFNRITATTNNYQDLANPRTDNAIESIVILLPGCMWTKYVHIHYESKICHKFVLVRSSLSDDSDYRDRLS